MKDKIKGIIIGLLIGMSLVTTGVLATNGAIQKELWYNNIKITLDGKTITPKDGNGNTVEPFTIDGTTYLPVRAISNALGLFVDWDANTNTVILSTSQSTQATEQLVYNKNGIKIHYKNYGYNDYGYLQLNFLIENNSSQPITVKAADTSINGYMIYGSMYDKVQVGKKANGKLEFSSDKLKENGITKVESIEFCFDIMNSDSYKDIDKSSAVVITSSGATVKKSSTTSTSTSTSTSTNTSSTTNKTNSNSSASNNTQKEISANAEDLAEYICKKGKKDSSGNVYFISYEDKDSTTYIYYDKNKESFNFAQEKTSVLGASSVVGITDYNVGDSRATVVFTNLINGTELSGGGYITPSQHKLSGEISSFKCSSMSQSLAESTKGLAKSSLTLMFFRLDDLLEEIDIGVTLETLGFENLSI